MEDQASRQMDTKTHKKKKTFYFPIVYHRKQQIKKNTLIWLQGF